MVDLGKGRGECAEVRGVGVRIHALLRYTRFQPGQDFAVQAAAMAFGAPLEARMERARANRATDLL